MLAVNHFIDNLFPGINMSDSTSFTTNTEADRRYHQRNHIESLLDRAKYLGETDCALIDQVYRYGSSVSSVARISGRSAPYLRRQIARSLKRINSPLFTFMIMHGDLLPAKVRRTATLVALRGYSQRRTANVSGQTLHRVRKHIEILRALARA